MSATPHIDPLIESLAEKIWKASDDFEDDPFVEWENNYARSEWYRMAEAVAPTIRPTDRQYEIHAVRQVAGVVDSWVGDEDNPERDVPEIVEEISSAMASALLDEPEDHSIVAVVVINPDRWA